MFVKSGDPNYEHKNNRDPQLAAVHKNNTLLKIDIQQKTNKYLHQERIFTWTRSIDLIRI